MAMPSLSRMELIASLSWLMDKNTMAKVGLKPPTMLCCSAFLISSGEFPLIDFAFIKVYIFYAVVSLTNHFDFWTSLEFRAVVRERNHGVNFEDHFLSESCHGLKFNVP